MTYRGVEYIKIRGYWRARPGHGTGERGERKPKKKPGEPSTFWECVNERNGHICGTKHRTRSGSAAHVRRLDRQAWKVGGNAARTWQPFKVVDGVGFHWGVGAPKGR